MRGLLGVGLLLAMTACGGGGGDLVTSADATPATPDGPSAWVDAVNRLCTAFDVQKTAVYEGALGDGELTAAEYVGAEAAVAPLAAQFDAAVAALDVEADPAGREAFTAYGTWVADRRTALDAAAAGGDDAVFGPALEASNESFFESEQVRAVKERKFVLECLSR